jgi:hypothetical protein
MKRSHGDGRRMTVAEAIERRARMIRFHGSVENAWYHGQETAREQSGADVLDWTTRTWVIGTCARDSEDCTRAAPNAEDCENTEGYVTTVCSTCRRVGRPAE